MTTAVAATAPAPAVNLATMPLEEALEAYTPNFEAALPETVKVDHFKRMVMTALSVNPELASADRRTLFNAAVKCASDGLLPDGREAALVVFRTKVKDRQGKERVIDAVQYMPMVAGIRKRMRNAGEVASATAEVVCKNDKFKYLKGDNPTIEHEPPPLDQDRGPEIGAYAIIKLTNGEVIRDVMSKADIERTRAQSRAPSSLMWTKFWGEGAKKTVLRRCSKAAPQSPLMERLMRRDEEPVELPPAEEMALVPDRPRRLQFQEAPAGEEIVGPLDEDLNRAVDYDPVTGEVRDGNGGAAGAPFMPASSGEPVQAAAAQGGAATGATGAAPTDWPQAASGRGGKG